MTRILIVEDERIIAWNIQEVLKLTGHDVVSSVSTAEEAITVVGQQKPDLVIMDIRLGGNLDGIAAAEEIYASHGIPSIFLTAHADDRTVERAMETAPFGYVVKPFKRNDLLLAIKVAINRHQQEKKSLARQQQFSAMLNSLNDGAIATDRDGHITYMNGSAERMTGWNAPDAIGKCIQDILDLRRGLSHQAIPNPVLAAMQTDSQVETPENCTIRLRDGTDRHVTDSTAAPIHNEQDDVIGGIMMLKELIEVNQYPKNGHTAHQPHAQAISDDVIASMEKKGATGYTNLLTKFTAAIRESLDDKSIIQAIVDDIGHNLNLLSCHIGVHQASDPDSPIVIAAFCQDNPDLAHFAIEGDIKSAVFRHFSLQHPIPLCLAIPRAQKANGKGTVQWVSAVACPIVNHQGALMGDILVTRHVNNPLNASEIELLRHTADQCAIAIRQSLLYQTIQNYHQDADARQLHPQLPDRWISALSHELRTPIANIKMASQMLELVLKPMGLLNADANPAHEYFQILRYECQREARLVDALVEANQDSATQVLTFNPINLPSLIDEVVNPCLWQIKKKNQHLVVESSDEVAVIETVPSILKRVLGEILDYACRYSPPNRDIQILTQPVTSGSEIDNETSTNSLDEVEIRVRHVNTHVSATELETALNVCYQDFEEHPQSYSGIGLGLFLAKQQVDKLLGRVTVRDEDGWITFRLHLPDKLQTQGVLH